MPHPPGALGCQKRMPGPGDRGGCKPAPGCCNGSLSSPRAASALPCRAMSAVLISTEAFQAELASPGSLIKAKLRPREGTG